MSDNRDGTETFLDGLRAMNDPLWQKLGSSVEDVESPFYKIKDDIDGAESLYEKSDRDKFLRKMKELAKFAKETKDKANNQEEVRVLDSIETSINQFFKFGY